MDLLLHELTKARRQVRHFCLLFAACMIFDVLTGRSVPMPVELLRMVAGVAASYHAIVLGWRMLPAMGLAGSALNGVVVSCVIHTLTLAYYL